MVCCAWIEAGSRWERIRPGLRLGIGLVGAGVMAALPGPRTAAAGLALALAATLAAGLPWRPVLRRLAAVAAILLPAALALWWSAGGGFGPTPVGARLGARVLLKGLAVVLWMTAWAGALDVATLGRVLAGWRVPARWVLLLLGTVRFAEGLHLDYRRRARAMRLRGFRARANPRTLRTLAEMAGLLLVLAFERSEQALRAMRLRGFDGRFRAFETGAAAPRRAAGEGGA